MATKAEEKTAAVVERCMVGWVGIVYGTEAVQEFKISFFCFLFLAG